MIDTHTHLYLRDEFGDDAESAVVRALDHDVEHLVFPNVDLSTMRPMLELHSKFKHATSVAIGLHPTEINTEWRLTLDKIIDLANDIDFVAIGEVGIDLYWDKTYREQQILALDYQLHLAEELSLPVIIHCREGLNEVLMVFENYNGVLPRCVFHSFTGNKDDVKRIKSIGDFYFGINGVVTFKNAIDLRNALSDIGLDRILLETDSPYLAPVPYRGKRNESAYLPSIAAKISETLCVSVDEVKQLTTLSARDFFGI